MLLIVPNYLLTLNDLCVKHFRIKKDVKSKAIHLYELCTQKYNACVQVVYKKAVGLLGVWKGDLEFFTDYDSNLG